MMVAMSYFTIGEKENVWRGRKEKRHDKSELLLAGMQSRQIFLS